MSSLILLLGPTASGKTALAMALQDALGGQSRAQIISIDSAMVYRGLDIGSAKPTAAELALYPHALIDLRDPAEIYTAADFVADADDAVRTTWAAGKTAILVGGTMLYARSFLQGLAELPSADVSTRDALREELKVRGEQALHAELAEIDAEAARGIEPANHQRLLRALEVVRLTGQPISTLWAKQADVSVRARLGVAPKVYGLDAWPRQALHARIETRFQAMLAAGFLDEVAGLQARGDLSLDLPAMRAVGYRQAWLHLTGELSSTAFQADALTATRRLAKRQLTWLRSWPDLRWLREQSVSAQVDAVRADGI